MSAASVAIVTGGGTGIGAAAAAALREQGWEVVICGRRPEVLNQVAAATGAHPIVADVASSTDMNRLVTETLDRFGKLNGLVLNAGIVRPGAAGELSDEDWEAMISTNLTGPFRLVRAALPHLLDTEVQLSAWHRQPRYEQQRASLAMTPPRRPWQCSCKPSPSTTARPGSGQTLYARVGQGRKWQTWRWTSSPGKPASTDKWRTALRQPSFQADGRRPLLRSLRSLPGCSQNGPPTSMQPPSQ